MHRNWLRRFAELRWCSPTPKQSTPTDSAAAPHAHLRAERPGLDWRIDDLGSLEQQAIAASWGNVPALYFMSKRARLSDWTVRAIVVVTVSGEPTHNALSGPASKRDRRPADVAGRYVVAQVHVGHVPGERANARSNAVIEL